MTGYEEVVKLLGFMTDGSKFHAEVHGTRSRGRALGPRPRAHLAPASRKLLAHVLLLGGARAIGLAGARAQTSESECEKERLCW
eukprot:2593502-Pleurochrysis_carterae.AAC.4